MITLVTGLWDIGRGNLNEGWNRSFDYYLEKFKELLQIDCNLIIFGDNHLEEFVFKYRNPTNTKFINRDLSWFRNNEYFDKIQKIRTNENWYNISGWLKESTQARLEYYNPLVMSKMFLLHDASILDSFNSEKLYWIDAGLTNTVNLGYFTRDNVLDKIESLFDKFMFVVFPYEAENEVHGFDYKKMCDYAKTKTEFVSRGGFFGGTKQKIADLNVLYYQLLIDTLNKNLMGTEESIFTIMTYLYPSLIDYCEIESNGLVYKFFEDVKNNTVVIKNKGKKVVTKYKGDIGLYVITFNSPKQFETLIKSMLDYDPDFIHKTKKFLLDNSTDLSTTPRYRELCENYNFQHIKKVNLGITRGRVFVAEHFNEQENLSHYFFFEDDFGFYSGKDITCKNGFIRKVDNLYQKTLEIIKKENFDYLKLNFTEFYGSHNKQWAWYNVSQEFRENHWTDSPRLPEQGLDPYSPNLEFKHIQSHKGLPYVSGEIYLSNWPILMTKEGNYNCYLKTKFDWPHEQTLMSNCYQETVKGNIKPGLLLATPTEHHRFEFYEPSLRKEC